MTSFFSKIFGGKTADASEGSEHPVEALVKDTLEGLFERGQFELQYDLTMEKDEKDESQIIVELSGPDEELVKGRDGQMIDALQLFVKRVVQHNFPEDRSNIIIDCGGFRQENQQALIDLADKLKEMALEKGKSVYFRALPPRDRKVIHQYLATDARVKSRSIGDGLFKKIKIYPIKSEDTEGQHTNS